MRATKEKANPVREPRVLKNDIKYKLRPKFYLSNERFYNERLKLKVFKFPFLISFFKNFKFNLLIFNAYFFYKINSKKNSYLLQKKLFEILYKNNIDFNHQLYSDYKSVLLLEKIIYFFRDFSVKKKHDPILVIIPQKYDLISDNKIFYQEFFKKIKKIKVIDLTNYLLGKKNIYIEDKYGGHLNSYGNYLVAKYLNEKIFDNLRNILSLLRYFVLFVSYLS